MCADSMLKERSSITNKEQDFIKSDMMNKKYYSNIQEIAFEYMSRFITARLLNKGQYKYLLNLKSYNGLLFIKNILKPKEYSFYEDLYEDYLSYIMEYVYSRTECIENLFGKTSDQIELNAYKRFVHNSSGYDYKYRIDKEKLIKCSLFFAKLETIFNNKIMIKDLSYITNQDNSVIYDLISRCDKYKEHLLNLKKM